MNLSTHKYPLTTIILELRVDKNLQFKNYGKLKINSSIKITNKILNEIQNHTLRFYHYIKL